MGYLTPILIHNDIAHLFKNKRLQKEICEKLYLAMIDGKEQTISVNNCCNYIKSLGSKHADDSRTIIVYGNTMVDITRESYKEINRIDNGYIEYLETCKRILETDIDCLNDKIKRLKQRKREVECE